LTAGMSINYKAYLPSESGLSMDYNANGSFIYLLFSVCAWILYFSCKKNVYRM